MKQNLVKLARKTILRPIVLWSGLMIAVVLAWQSFLSFSRALDIPSDNMLPNGSFEQVDEQGRPHNWGINHYGDVTVGVSSVDGFVDGMGLRVDISDYKDGVVAIETPRLSATPNTHYFFKAFYLTDVDHSLLVRFGYADGSSKYVLAQYYPDYDYPWSTMSAGVNSDETATEVSFVIQLAANGFMELDGAYVTHDNNGADVTSCTVNVNLVPNASFAELTGAVPAQWEPYTFGAHQATHTIRQDGAQRHVSVAVENYQDGEAKWIYTKQPIAAHQPYCFSFEYRADTQVELYAEYTLADGSIRFDFLEDLLPTAQWTHAAFSAEAPASAVDVRITANLRSDGFVESRNYTLTPTGNDTSTFSRPLVSLTFDDGWASSYTNGARLLDEFGMLGTFYVNPGFAGAEDFMSEDDLRDLLARGHQVGSHGQEHIDLTSFTPKRVEEDLVDAKRYLESVLGINDIDFASPYGKHDARADALIQASYISHRGTDLGVNTKQNFDPNNLKILFMRRETPLSEVVEQLEQAKASNGWLILVYHQIEPTDNTFIVPEDAFRQQLEAVGASGIDVQTVRSALNELQPQL